MNDNPLQMLRDDVAPGSWLTPDGLLAAGRRRVRRRRAALTGAAAALVLVVTVGVAAVAAERRPQPPAHPGPVPSPTAAPTASTEPGCRQQVLAVPGGSKVERVVVDRTGSWAAGLRADRRGVVIWHDGAVSSVVSDISVTNLAGISSAGVAAGSGLDAGGRSRALTFQGTYATTLALPAGAKTASFTYAWDINAGGDVVGMYDATAPGARSAVVWWHRDPIHPVLMTAPGGEHSAGIAIDDNGDVGGYVGDLSSHYRPVVWTADGAGVELDLAAGKRDGMVSGFGGGQALDLAENVRWTPGPGKTTPEVYRTTADDLVGQDAGADGTVLLSSPKRAQLWREGRLTELPVPAGAQYVRAWSVNHDASVVGGVSANLQATQAGVPLLWICGPG